MLRDRLLTRPALVYQDSPDRVRRERYVYPAIDVHADLGIVELSLWRDARGTRLKRPGGVRHLLADAKNALVVRLDHHCVSAACFRGGVAAVMDVEFDLVDSGIGDRIPFCPAQTFMTVLKNSSADRSLGEGHSQSLNLSADKAVQGGSLLPTVTARYAAVNA